MTYHLIILLSALSWFTTVIIPFDVNHNKSNTGDNLLLNTMKITIGSKTFKATLNDSEAAKAFRAMLPLTLNLDDFNGNEKKYDFPKSFPTNSVNPRKINAGDLMIWSGNTFVLFYKTFPTPYSYTKLGQVDDPSGLAAALGGGSITITFKSAN
jgi:hypothetical protein